MAAHPENHSSPSSFFAKTAKWVASVDWLNAQWLSAGCAVAACLLIITYDSRLGIAAATLLAVSAAFWLYIALSFGTIGQRDKGQVAAMSEKFEAHQMKLRQAEARERELARKAALRAEQAADRR
ncbi:MAG: hypothetical protein ACXIT4_00040 [Erythrobacter sp.]